MNADWLHCSVCRRGSYAGAMCEEFYCPHCGTQLIGDDDLPPFTTMQEIERAHGFQTP